jgi:hypothetical protein
MRGIVAAWLVVAVIGCGGGKDAGGDGNDGGNDGDVDSGSADHGPQIPRITPIVRDAVPMGLNGNAQRLLPILNAGDIKDRFFGPGPSDVYAILQGVDGLIDEINIRSAPCKTQAPVEYTVEAWGQSLTVSAQCTGDTSLPAFMQFGTASNGATWINVTNPTSRVLAKVTPIASATDAGPQQYTAHVWLTIPVNMLDCSSNMRGSYGAIEIVADPTTKEFEMVVAGSGLGYCGVQVKSDATDVYVIGSQDNGSNCGAIDTLCGEASDVSMPSICGASTTTFALPSLGRQAVGACNMGASQYPASGNTVDISGSATDTVQTFETRVPVAGLGMI